MATSLFQSKAPLGSPAWLHNAIAASQTEIRSEKIALTPALANELLRNNDGNRNISAVAVAQLSADITANRWSVNGEPIIVAKNGLLIDGQHRCHAVIDANTPIETLIVLGVLHIEGIPNSNVSAAIARLALAFERSEGQHLNDAKYITATQVALRVHADPKIAFSATLAARYAQPARKYVSGSVLGFCHYILSRIDPVAAQDYIEKVAIGEGLKRNDAAYSVRERLLSEGKQRDKKIALIFRGWTFYRRNRSVAVTSLPAKLPFPALF